MLLTITTTHTPATDLGYLLAKNPARAQSFPLSFGQAHVFYPEVSEHRTTLAIAHRLSTVADADTIFVLEHGRLAESGSHAALLRRDGLYAEMWNRQLSEREQTLDEAAE